MGRPLNKKYFGEGPGLQIKVTAKIGDADPAAGYIVKQNSTSLYLIDVDGDRAFCSLVGKAAEDLEANEFTVNVTTAEGDTFHPVKITSKKMTLNDGSSVNWSFGPSATVAVEEIDAPPSEDLITPVQTNNVTISAPFRKGTSPNWRLLVGNNNDATKMITATNGEIEIALSSRIVGTGAPPSVSPTGSTYNLTVPVDRDWNWTFAFGIKNNPNHVAITDLYDIKYEFSIGSENYKFEVKMIDGALHFIDTAHGFDVTDSYVNADKSILQNIQRHSFLANSSNNYLGQSHNPVGALLGTYTFTATATRKLGNYPPVVAHYTVVATSA